MTRGIKPVTHPNDRPEKRIPNSKPSHGMLEGRTGDWSAHPYQQRRRPRLLQSKKHLAGDDDLPNFRDYADPEANDLPDDDVEPLLKKGKVRSRTEGSIINDHRGIHQRRQILRQSFSKTPILGGPN